MSTVLFKKFTAFVVGVISILVMCAGSVSAQNYTLNVQQNTTQKCNGQANLSLTLTGGGNYQARILKYSIGGVTTNVSGGPSSIDITNIPQGGTKSVTVTYDVYEWKQRTNGNGYSWQRVQQNQTKTANVVNNGFQLGGGGTIDICSNTYTLIGTALTNGATGTWSGDATGTGNPKTVTVPTNRDGKYKWTQTRNGCSASETYIIRNHSSEMSNFKMDPDKVVCAPHTTTRIGASIPSGATSRASSRD